MHGLDHEDTLHENRLAPERRPKALPNEWGAHWLAEDLVERANVATFRQSEQLYMLGVTAYQQMLAIGPPWTCFRRCEFSPWPEYNSERPVGTEPDWCAFDVETYADFLAHYEGGLPGKRVMELLQNIDLFADYMVAVAAIDEPTRGEWVTRAQGIVTGLAMTTNRSGHRALRKIKRSARRDRRPVKRKA